MPPYMMSKKPVFDCAYMYDKWSRETRDLQLPCCVVLLNAIFMTICGLHWALLQLIQTQQITGVPQAQFVTVKEKPVIHVHQQLALS